MPVRLIGASHGPLSTICFVETPTFTRRIVELGLEAALRELQLSLSQVPTLGRTDAGTGGLRKVRLPDASRNKGKRSGARAHYLYLAVPGVIYLLYVYGKDDQETLSPKQKRMLATIASLIRAEWSDTTRPRDARPGHP